MTRLNSWIFAIPLGDLRWFTNDGVVSWTNSPSATQIFQSLSSFPMCHVVRSGAWPSTHKLLCWTQTWSLMWTQKVCFSIGFHIFSQDDTWWQTGLFFHLFALLCKQISTELPLCRPREDILGVQCTVVRRSYHPQCKKTIEEHQFISDVCWCFAVGKPSGDGDSRFMNAGFFKLDNGKQKIHEHLHGLGRSGVMVITPSGQRLVHLLQATCSETICCFCFLDPA